MSGFPEHDGGACEKDGAEECGGGREEASAEAECDEGGADGGEEAGEAVHPDRVVAGVFASKDPAGADGRGGGLEPVDEGGLLEAGAVLDARDDPVVPGVGFEHLAAGLNEAGFVAVDGGDSEEAGEVEEEAEEDEEPFGARALGQGATDSRQDSQPRDTLQRIPIRLTRVLIDADTSADVKPRL